MKSRIDAGKTGGDLGTQSSDLLRFALLLDESVDGRKLVVLVGLDM